MGSLRFHPAWLPLALLAGCLEATSSGIGVAGDESGHSGSGGHTGAGTRASTWSSGGATSTASASSVGGSSSGLVFSGGSGSSGGTGVGCGPDGGGPPVTGEMVCPAVAACPTTASCTTGSAFSAQLVDYVDCTVLGGATVTAVDPTGLPYDQGAGMSATDGVFSLCSPSGAPFSVRIQAAGYPNTYYAEMQVLAGGSYGQMAALSTDEYQAFAAVSPCSFMPTDAAILVKLAGSACHNALSGWSFDLTLPDGGALPDGGYQLLYFGSGYIPDMNATSTGSKGLALFINIDPSIADFLVVTATNPDAGDCVPQNADFGFTGRVYIAGNAATIDPILLP